MRRFELRVALKVIITFNETLMDADKWLTLDELAGYLKLSKSNLYRMTQKGEVPASKIGTRWRFDRDEIDIWVKNQKPITDSSPINRD